MFVGKKLFVTHSTHHYKRHFLWEKFPTRTAGRTFLKFRSWKLRAGAWKCPQKEEEIKKSTQTSWSHLQNEDNSNHCVLSSCKILASFLYKAHAGKPKNQKKRKRPCPFYEKKLMDFCWLGFVLFMILLYRIRCTMVFLTKNFTTIWAGRFFGDVWDSNHPFPVGKSLS